MALQPRSVNRPYLTRASRPIAPSGIARAKSNVTLEYVRSVIYALNKDTGLWASSLSDALNQILEIGIASLDCQVAGVWQMNKAGDELFCIAQHELGIGAVEPSGDLSRELYPSYFNGFLSSRVIAVEDCLSDFRTEELVQPYLIPHNVSAILGSPIRREGGIHGIIVFEQLNDTRQWTGPERDLAISIAELLNQIMLVSELREQNRLLTLLNSIASESRLMHTPEALAKLGMEKLQVLYPDVWAGFYKIYDQHDMAKLVCCVGDDIPDFARAACQEVPINEGLIKKVTDLGEVFVIPDCDNWSELLSFPMVDIAIAIGVQSIISIPLKSNTEILGFIQVWSKNKIYNLEKDYEGYKAIASTFAVDYANAVNVEKLTHSAFHDSLTGLFNREQFHIDIKRIGPDDVCLLLLVELRGFKHINDTLGHASGDDILEMIARRLQDFAEDQSDVSVYRLSGAELCLLHSSFSGDADQFAALVQSLIVEPIGVNGIHIVLNPVIGMALTPVEGKGLLRSADVALSWAKKGDKLIALYDAGKDNLGPENRQLLTALRHALAHDELMVYYQPLFNLNTGRMESCEALLRWNHPEHGFIEPSKFVAIAESGDLIRTLTMWVTRQTISQISIFNLMEIDVSVAINVSTLDIVDLDFPMQIRELLGEFDVKATDLTLDITEAVLMSDPERALAVILELKKMGLKIDIDDFGTGYSSIAYLRQLPINSLKIDGSFILNLSHNKQHQKIVRSIIGMAHGLGVKVVAEGVEDEITLQTLKALGCELAQGYFFGRPVPAAEFISSSNKH